MSCIGYPAAAYSDVFFVPEATWSLFVNRPPAAFVEQAGWYAAYDGSGVQSNKAAALTQGITTVTSEMGQLSPGWNCLNRHSNKSNNKQRCAN
jgi:hypothetical protein